MPNRVDISERSPETEKREEAGHREGDSVVGVGKGSALHTEVERKTRFLMVKKIPRKGAEETKGAMISLFSPLPNLLRKTGTLDNGCEFTRHAQVASHLQMKIHFAKPCHSWERGSNENANGMIRRYFPKGTDFDTVSDEAIQEVVNMINSRPRKILGYRSSAELFAEYFP